MHVWYWEQSRHGVCSFFLARGSRRYNNISCSLRQTRGLFARKVDAGQTLKITSISHVVEFFRRGENSREDKKGGIDIYCRLRASYFVYSIWLRNYLRVSERKNDSTTTKPLITTKSAKITRTVAWDMILDWNEYMSTTWRNFQRFCHTDLIILIDNALIPDYEHVVFSFTRFALICLLDVSRFVDQSNRTVTYQHDVNYVTNLWFTYLSWEASIETIISNI